VEDPEPDRDQRIKNIFKNPLTRGFIFDILTKLAREGVRKELRGESDRTLKTIQKKETRNRKKTAKIPKSIP